MGKKLKQLMTEKLKVWFGGCFFFGGGEGREGCFLFWSPPPKALVHIQNNGTRDIIFQDDFFVSG